MSVDLVDLLILVGAWVGSLTASLVDLRNAFVLFICNVFMMYISTLDDSSDNPMQPKHWRGPAEPAGCFADVATAWSDVIGREATRTCSTERLIWQIERFDWFSW